MTERKAQDSGFDAVWLPPARLNRVLARKRVDTGISRGREGKVL